MAIIRIKRTTGSNLPTGLTFGELAFIGASGGATANRLYIAGPQGACVWIGAEILNQPTFWSGITAATTIPTVSAVESRVVAGGGLTFSSDLSVNIAIGKFFGKYTRGDTIPAQGQTVKWVIENALSETISPTVPSLTFTSPNNSVAYGQTSGTITVNVGYTIQTVGAIAAGTTLEYRYGSGSWILLSNALKNTSTTYSQSYSASFNRLTDSGADGRWGSNTITYRYTVHDTAGASASNTGTITPSTIANPSVDNWSIAANSLRTGVLGATSGTETNQYREKGNTFSTISFRVNRANSYIALTSWVLEASQFFNGSFSAYVGVTNGSIPSGNTTTISGITYTPSVSGASLDQLRFRVRINDENYDGAGSGPGTTFENAATSDVYFNYMVFYGATATVPSSASDFRGLCSGLISGNPTVNFGSGANIGTQPSGVGIHNPFVGLPGNGTSNKVFIVALPDGITLTGVLDSGDSFNDQLAAFNFGGSPNTSFTQIPDRSGTNKNYNVYIMSNAQAYNDNRYHIISRDASNVSQP